MTTGLNINVILQPKYTILFLCALALFAFNSCKKPPEYPDVPNITFNNLEVIQGPSSIFDTIILSVDFFEEGGTKIFLLKLTVHYICNTA